MLVTTRTFSLLTVHSYNNTYVSVAPPPQPPLSLLHILIKVAECTTFRLIAQWLNQSTPLLTLLTRDKLFAIESFYLPHKNACTKR
jgi:hypothetical protein